MNTLESIGPFSTYKLKLNGYLVPYVSGFKDDKGTWHLHLDRGSCGLDIPDDLALSVVWFIANAMAVSAGYTCFGENSQESNLFTRRINQIGMASELELVEAEEEHAVN